jgi:hypothetical protein
MLVGLVSACTIGTASNPSEGPAPTPTSQPPPVPTTQGPPDGQPTLDASNPPTDASTEAAADGGTDAPPPLPPLCKTYPDTAIELFPGGPLFQRYFAIALQTMQRARADCAIGSHFATFGSSDPIQIACLANELAAVAGCTDENGKALNYAESVDPNGALCAPADPVTKSVRIGFHNAKANGVTNADVDRLLGIVETAAASAKLAPEDAQRLKSELDAKRSTAVGSTAAGFSAAKPDCDAGM